MASNFTNIDDNWQNQMPSLKDSVKFLFNKEIMSDVMFVFNSKEGIQKKIYAHSWLLSLLSPIFYESFKGNFEVMKEIPVSKTSFETFWQFISFIYTNECILTNENAFDILTLAEKYSVEYLKRNCCNYISTTLTVDSVCRTLELVLPSEQLKQKVLEFIAPNISQVLQTESFLKVSKNTLEAILSMEQTGPLNEFQLFNVVMKWSENHCILNNMVANGTNKRFVLGDLIKKIQFSEMSTNELGLCVAREDGLLTPSETQSLLIDIVTNQTKTVGFSDHSRRQLINNNISEKPTNRFDTFNSNEIWVFNDFLPSVSTKSTFTVNKTIHLTRIRIGQTSKVQNATITLLNSNNFMISEIIFEVGGLNTDAFSPILNSFVLLPGHRYSLIIKYSDTSCKFKYVNHKDFYPMSKYSNRVKFEFTEWSRLLFSLEFKIHH